MVDEVSVVAGCRVEWADTTHGVRLTTPLVNSVGPAQTSRVGAAFRQEDRRTPAVGKSKPRAPTPLQKATRPPPPPQQTAVTATSEGV